MLPALHAERQIAAIEASSFADLKPESGRDVMQRLHRQLGRETEQQVRPKDLSALAGIGIQVEQVKGDAT